MSDRKRELSPFEIRRQLETCLEGKLPAARLRAFDELRSALDRRQHRFVDELRDPKGPHRWTWDRVGQALGVSRQAAFQRFCDHVTQRSHNGVKGQLTIEG